MKDLFGQALLDYYLGDSENPLVLHNKFSKPDSLELDGYFFKADELDDFDLIALSFCEGKILDIGAAAGRHSLYLQQEGMEVYALDISHHCCELMKKNGVKNIIHQNIFDPMDQKFDTLFMLMNGIGITGNVPGFRSFLNRAKSLISESGILIVDSADVSYLNEEYQLPQKEYLGEIEYQYEYKNEFGEWFTWLYIDKETLKKVASEEGWEAQIVYQEEDGQYLGILNLL